jgi:hypothetical protein
MIGGERVATARGLVVTTHFHIRFASIQLGSASAPIEPQIVPTTRATCIAGNFPKYYIFYIIGPDPQDGSGLGRGRGYAFVGGLQAVSFYYSSAERKLYISVRKLYF